MPEALSQEVDDNLHNREALSNPNDEEMTLVPRLGHQAQIPRLKSNVEGSEGMDINGESGAMLEGRRKARRNIR